MANGNNKIATRGHFQFNFDKDISDKYKKIGNKTKFVSELIEEYFDDSIIKVKIDDSIKKRYEEDPYKDIRIRLLLLEFYTKGNINALLSNIEPMSLPTNITTSSDRVIENEISVDNKEFNNNSTNIINEDISKNKFENNIDRDTIENNIKVEQNDIEFNNNEERNNEKTDNPPKEKIDHEIDNKEDNDTFDIPEEKVGSIKNMFKGNVPKNNRNLI